MLYISDSGWDYEGIRERESEGKKMKMKSMSLMMMFVLVVVSIGMEKEGPLRMAEGACSEILSHGGCVVSKCTSDCVARHPGMHGNGKCDKTSSCVCTYWCTPPESD